MMHTVGRAYARRHHVTLATMMDYLPQSNDPSCPAGFAHGLITGVAPQIDLANPKSSARVCTRTATRYERYSCVHGFGHAFMRLTGEQLKPSLAFCLRLGRSWGLDCAGGVFHDYWLAVKGYDNTVSPGPRPVTDPRKLCARAGAAVRQGAAGTAPSWRAGPPATRPTRPPAWTASAPGCAAPSATRASPPPP